MFFVNLSLNFDNLWKCALFVIFIFQLNSGLKAHATVLSRDAHRHVFVCKECFFKWLKSPNLTLVKLIPLWETAPIKFAPNLTLTSVSLLSLRPLVIHVAEAQHLSTDT